MSACRLDATIDSMAAGLSTMRVVIASTSIAVGLDIREFVSDGKEDLIPQHHAMALGIRLGDERQVLARALPRQLEGEAMHALDAAASEGGDLHRHLVLEAGVHAAARARVFALGVLAHDHPVDVAPAISGT